MLNYCAIGVLNWTLYPAFVILLILTFNAYLCSPFLSDFAQITYTAAVELLQKEIKEGRVKFERYEGEGLGLPSIAHCTVLYSTLLLGEQAILPLSLSRLLLFYLNSSLLISISSTTFRYPNWGDDLGSEHERYLCEKVRSESWRGTG